ncbi:MAG: oligosaccharide repeat unit polymerase [Bacteroidetes bacterium]|nr:oligosaccharide repeat unit polymerase [Bacteroidota bacterium]
MDFYLLLTLSTIIIFLLGFFIFIRTKSLAFPIGILLLYFFSLYGAWFIVYDKMNLEKGASFGLHYYYLMLKMFNVELDQYYFNTLLMYSLFIVIIELTILSIVPCNKNKPHYANFVIKINHYYLIAGSFICMLASAALVSGALRTMLQSGESAYHIARTSTETNLFTLHQLLNRAIIPIVIGFTTLFMRDNKFFDTKKISPRIWILYFFTLVCWIFYLTILGNKHEFFVAIAASGLIYLESEKQVKKSLIVFGVFLGILMLGSINVLRQYSLMEIFSNINPQLISLAFSDVIFSNEMMGAHLSLYGILYYHVPIAGGFSLISLFASTVPKIFWTGRPDDIYNYYATSVGAMEGQGYTIHHAAGWYLNFGLPGIIIGAIFFGFLWGWTYKKIFSPLGNSKFAILKLFPFFLITAAIPTLIRAGIEGYKSLLIDALLIPLVFLFIVSKMNKVGS